MYIYILLQFDNEKLRVSSEKLLAENLDEISSSELAKNALMKLPLENFAEFCKRDDLNIKHEGIILNLVKNYIMRRDQLAVEEKNPMEINKEQPQGIEVKKELPENEPPPIEENVNKDIDKNEEKKEEPKEGEEKKENEENKEIDLKKDDKNTNKIEQEDNKSVEIQKPEAKNNLSLIDPEIYKKMTERIKYLS